MTLFTPPLLSPSASDQTHLPCRHPLIYRTDTCVKADTRNDILQIVVQETYFYHIQLRQESCAIAKMTAQCALYMGALKIFGTPWLRPRLLFPTFSRAFVRIDPLNVSTKFEVRSFISSSDNRGYPTNLDSPWIRLRSLNSKIFNRLLFRLTL